MSLRNFRLPNLRPIFGALCKCKPKASAPSPAEWTASTSTEKWHPTGRDRFYRLIRQSTPGAPETQKPVPAWSGHSQRHFTARRRAMAAHYIKRGCRA
jgi:hypothetical protein